MATIRLTKEFAFEAAHALEGYDGACREIHGHSYRLFVTVAGRPVSDPADPKYGMIMDFGVLKKLVGDRIISRFDHSLVLRRTPQNSELADMLAVRFARVVRVEFQPTCENLLVYFASLLEGEMPEGVKLCSLRLHETATSYAEWLAD